MTEAVTGYNDSIEFEIRGGLWEGIHAVIFYISVTCAVLASVGILSIAFGIACVVLLSYSMFTIFSSPTFVIIDPASREAILESYHYFIPSRHRVGKNDLEGLEIIESQRLPAAEGEKGSRRDLSYFVRVYMRLKDGRRLKIFRSGMTGAPADNRSKAFLIVQGLSGALDIPVSYTRRGVEKERDNSEHDAL
jgi:hypothetical protein